MEKRTSDDSEKWSNQIIYSAFPRLWEYGYQGSRQQRDHTGKFIVDFRYHAVEFSITEQIVYASAATKMFAAVFLLSRPILQMISIQLVGFGSNKVILI